jgi:hypothetical protein
VDKLLFELPIPRFDANDAMHRNLVRAAREAERIAASVSLPEEGHFIRHRRMIRKALKDAGLTVRIEALIAEFLP